MDPRTINRTKITRKKMVATCAVRIGCHAFNLCCLKAESVINKLKLVWYFFYMREQFE
jgi:hypothetical protein